MSEDDFFEKLDAKMSEMKAEAAAKEERHDANRDFAKAAIPELRPIADEYASKLLERGISAKVSSGEHGISFKMQWADNSDHGLSVEQDYKTGRLSITRHSTDHTTGKRFRSTDGVSYDASTWDATKFESALKGVINDYIFYADKHQGIA